jgi:hypothetical protein
LTTSKGETTGGDDLTCKEVMMETLLIPILLFIALDLVAWHWGLDSTEKLESPEWERRWMGAASHHEYEGNHPGTRRKTSNGHLPARKLLDK